MSIFHPAPSRRAFLIGSASFALAASLPPALATATTGAFKLVAAPGRVPLVGAPHGETAIWSYNGQLPGPEIRIPQGERLRVLVENQLPEETTVHWHGIRLPNAMDGVPHLTQKPIAPGESFLYEFDCPDAGTFWYHPHQRSFAQVGRGLYGSLIVEERKPIAVDRELTWVLGDWRLLTDASISEDFGNFHDVSHAGRIGNTVTINGRVPDRVAVRADERIRLRLINAANARIFALRFHGHDPWIVALDGQPVEPHRPDGDLVVIGPAMRVDLILDMNGKPGAHYEVEDKFYRGLEYRLVTLAYGDKPVADDPFRGDLENDPIRLAANPLAEPDLETTERHEVRFGGGMMGALRSASVDGQELPLRAMMQHGLAWAINGVAATGHLHEPMLTLQRGRSYVLSLINETAWPHPVHLHGHAFRVVSRNGRPTQYREWQDTVLVLPQERAEIAFVADNPGNWMIHCHILEHQAGGMMAAFRVV